MRKQQTNTKGAWVIEKVVFGGVWYWDNEFLRWVNNLNLATKYNSDAQANRDLGVAEMHTKGYHNVIRINKLN